MTDEYEPPTVVVYHVDLTPDHIRELRNTGQIVCEFDADGDEEYADKIEVHVETNEGSEYRVDDLLE